MRHFDYSQYPEEYNPDYYIPMTARQRALESNLAYETYLRCDISGEVSKVESTSPLAALAGGTTETESSITWSASNKVEKKVFMLSVLLLTTAETLANTTTGGHEDGMYFAQKPFAYRN